MQIGYLDIKTIFWRLSFKGNLFSLESKVSGFTNKAALNDSSIWVFLEYIPGFDALSTGMM